VGYMAKKGREIEFKWGRKTMSVKTGNARYRCLHGGRSSMKSHFFAQLMINRHITAKTDSICGREYQKSLRHSAKRLLESKIREKGLEDYFQIKHDRIDSPYGGIIIFEGLRDHTADSIKSFEGFDIFWGEEAQRFSQKSLDLIRPTIIRKKDAELWFSWNPYLPTDPVDHFFRGNDKTGKQMEGFNPPPGTLIESCNYYDNPFLDDNAMIEIEYDKKRDYDKYMHVWEGQYLYHSDAMVFKNWMVDEFEAPPNAIHRFGADFGFATDPSTLVRSHIIGKTLYIDFEAYQIGCKINNLPDLYRQVPGSEKWPIIADSARPDTIAYLRDHGFPDIYGAAKGSGSIDEGVEWLKSYDIIVHPRCVHTIDELTHYRYKIDENTIDPSTGKPKILPILEDKNNHIIDPLRYSHEGHRRAQKQEDNDRPYYQPIPTTSPYNRN